MSKERKNNNKKNDLDIYYKNKKTHHLARVHSANGMMRDYTSITHSNKNVVDEFGNHIVLKLIDNPNPNDKRPAYVVDYVYTGSRNDFKSRKNNYITTKANKKIFDDIIKRH